MALGVLCLGLTLLGALRTQARDSTTKLIPDPFLHKVPLQPGFRANQFQGKWYTVGLAGNTVWKDKQGFSMMYSTTYHLKKDHSFNVTSTLYRDRRCDSWIRTFVPKSHPGQFNLGNIANYPQIRSYIMQVTATDYNQFAIVFFRKTTNDRVYFKTTLYGRTKELPDKLKQRFVHFAKYLGLSDDHIIFPVPTDQCIGN